MNKLVPHPDNRIGVIKAIKGDFDDVYLSDRMDTLLQQFLPAQWDKAKEGGIEHCKNWIRKAEEKKVVDPTTILKELKKVKAELAETKKKLIDATTKNLDEALNDDVNSPIQP